MQEWRGEATPTIYLFCYNAFDYLQSSGVVSFDIGCAT